MMKRFTISIIFSLALVFSAGTAFGQTVYASLGSGAWNSGTVWETYPTLAAALAASPGGGTASTSTTNPGGTHFVLIRAGHTITMGDANRGCKGIVIQAGGKLWNTGGVGDRRLQIGAGGTGFTYPLVDTVQVDGTMGGPNDPMYIESGINAQQIKIFGSGAIDIKRIRTIGGAGSAAGGVLTLDINADVNLWQSANYAFTCIYNPSATDNYTVNLFAGKTITVKTADGYFNNNSVGSGTGFGNYTYNINGTVDLTVSTQTAANLSAISPTAGTINLNIGATGLIKTGTAFNSSPVSPGVANLTIASGGVLDGTLATVMNFNGSNFVTNGTGIVKRTVTGDGIRSSFPVATASGGNNTAVISRENTSGTAAVYTANVQNTFTNAPADANKCVTRQWNIAITGTPSIADTVRLSWLLADQAAGFDPAGAVSIMHWTGAAWEYKTASVTGTGVAADPYVAKATGFSGFSPFGVTTFVAVPVTLLSFNASYNNRQVSLNWKTTNELNSRGFEIERSTDGINFNSIGSVNAYNNTASNSYSFTDQHPVSGASFYRLKMIDIDGKFKYSSVVSINTKLKNGISIYPNPAGNNVTISHPAAGNNAAVAIYTVDGKQVAAAGITKGAVQTGIDISGLVPGNYSILITDGVYKSSVKFVKQ